MQRSRRHGAEIHAEIRIHGLGPALAEAAARSIRPDDREAPPWLRIEEKTEGDDLVVTVDIVDADAARLGSLRNTVDEILSVLYALLRSLEEAAKPLKTGEGSRPQARGG